MTNRLSTDRDSNGVPHIQADTLEDALRGLGQCHATDRGMQMLLVRILGQGRACECLADDEEMLKLDRFFRRMNFGRGASEQAAQLSDEHRRVLDSYIAGVNDVLAAGNPWELRLAGYRAREPWTPADCVMLMRLVGYISLAQTQADLETLLVDLARAGVSRAHLDELFPGLLDGLDLELLRRLIPGERVIPAGVKFAAALPALTASNNWAIAGRKTASGSALLASDPHLEINRLPAMWYEAALSFGEGYALGATIPGLPGVLIGRTRELAWGATYSFLDGVDSWLEECRDGKALRQSERGESWAPFTARKETIRRKKQAPLELVFYENEHGTLEGDPHQAGLHRATRWAGADSGAASIAAMFQLLSAQTLEEGRRLLGRLEPSFHWVLADRAGQIGYQMSGAMPRRPAHWRGLVPLPGWDARNDWQGLVSPDELPGATDPECGFVATANDDLNHLRPAGAPMPINACMADYRAKRIAEQLAARNDWTPEAMGQLQLDDFSRQMAEYLGTLVKLGLLTGEDDRRAMRALVAWDGRYKTESFGATIFERFYAALIRRVFGGMLGPEVIEHLLGETYLVANYFGHLDRILLAEESVWFGGVPRAELYRQALTEALEGPAVPWQDVQRVEFEHLLFGDKLPRFLGFNRGPFALAGGRGSVNQVQSYRFGGRDVAIGAGFRMVTDLGQDVVQTMLAGGPSDRRFSKWYASGLAGWREGKWKTIAPR